VPSELDGVTVIARSPDGRREEVSAPLRSGADLPATLGLLHPGGALGPFAVEVRGMSGSDLRVVRTATFTFVAGKTLTLTMRLLRSCLDIACPEEGTTCERGTCVSDTVDPGALTPWAGRPEPIRAAQEDEPRGGEEDGGEGTQAHPPSLDAGDDSPGPSVDAGGGAGGGHDGGSASSEGGLPPASDGGGTPASDAGGSSSEDGGMSTPDGGSWSDDAGTSSDDGGTSSDDAGTSSDDAGASSEDAGGTPSDAGTDPPVCTPQPETCNGRDDDCNGVVDDSFDLNNDVTNCGRCGNVCDLPHAEATCSFGRCRVVACAEGYRDCDDRSYNGCEADLGASASCGSCGIRCIGQQRCCDGSCSTSCP
jgi:hypothetical protein